MSAGKEKNTAHEALAEQKYRPLKKSLKNSFATLRESVEQERLPPTIALEQFIAEARIMISYPGFGDEMYDKFWHSCQALQAAHNDQDLERFRECLALVRTGKKECHARFK